MKKLIALVLLASVFAGLIWLNYQGKHEIETRLARSEGYTRTMDPWFQTKLSFLEQADPRFKKLTGDLSARYEKGKDAVATMAELRNHIESLRQQAASQPGKTQKANQEKTNILLRELRDMAQDRLIETQRQKEALRDAERGGLRTRIDYFLGTIKRELLSPPAFVRTP